MIKITEARYDNLFEILKPGYGNPWRTPNAFSQPGEARARWRMEVNEWLKAFGGTIERDRSQVADVFSAIMEAIRRREWLRLGRGSYEYDDDRWRDEFSQAMDEVIEAAKPLRMIAGDWSDCPMTPEEIAEARGRSF